MQQAEHGDTVQIHFTATLADGELVGSSREQQEPLGFTIGANQVLPGVEAGVLGMVPGERKQMTLSAEEAYGPYRKDLVGEVPRDQLPPDTEITVGERLVMRGPEAREISALITDASDETVRLDANHPLAGQQLVVDVELLAIAPTG